MGGHSVVGESSRSRRLVRVGLGALVALAGLPLMAAAPSASAATSPGAIAYSNIPATLAGNYPAVGFQATSTSEFGDHVILASNAAPIAKARVTLSSWACQTGGGVTCATTPGATYNHPLTFRAYSVKTVAGKPAPDAKLLEKTQTFAIPYRPSANLSCTGGRWSPNGGVNCFNGYAFNVEWNLLTLSPAVTLPSQVIWTISFNTNTWGEAPLGVSGPYESLNVAVGAAPTTGTDPDGDMVMWKTANAGFYADGGAAGVNVLRWDTGWAGDGVPMAELQLYNGDIAVGNASVTEGDTGTQVVNVPVTLSDPVATAITVNYTLADGTATAPDDYVAATGSITIPANATSANIPVSVKGDLTHEPTPETFSVNLTASSIGTITGATGTVTINDNNDPQPTASIPSSPVEIVEGNSGTQDVVVPVTLSAASAEPITVGYYTQAGQASNITSDYVNTIGTLSFAPGETAKSFTIKVNGDLKLENNESFIARLGSTTNATTGNTSMKITILNDEKPKLVLARPAGVVEGRDVTFRPKLSHSYYLPVTIAWNTVNGSAAAPGDFTALAAGPANTAVIPKGERGPVAVVVTTKVDGATEVAETFSLFVSSASAQNSISNLGTIKGNAT